MYSICLCNDGLNVKLCNFVYVGSGCGESVSPLEVYRKEFLHVTDLINTLKKTTMEIRDSSDSETVANFLERLKQIHSRLKSGKLRAGVVGFRKTGKSTMLNAMLGNSFLPVYVHPLQTINEVSIIHDPSIPNGTLLAVKKEGNKPQPIANGREKIHQKLLELNDLKHTSGFSYNRLILRAPLQFLNDLGDTPLDVEFTDIPGLGRTGWRQNSEGDELDIKDMCAFVLILNYGNTRGCVEEPESLSDLSTYYPELFYKLNRILVVVNAYDVAYRKEDNIPGVQKISEEVSNYLRKPHMLARKIRANRIIPVSAKWALKAREWSSNVSALVNHEKAEEIYEEVVFLLRRAGYKEEMLSLSEKPSKDTTLVLSRYLEEFSNFSLAEKNLTELLYTHGRAALLDSAVNDTISLTNEIQKEVTLLIQKENLKQKQKCRQFWKVIAQRYNDTLQNYSHIMLETLVESASETKVGSVRDSLNDSLNGLVSTEIISELYDVNEPEEELVIERIFGVKSALPAKVSTRMKLHWDLASDTLDKVAVERVQTAVLQFQSDLLSTISNLDPCNVDDIETFSKTISSNLNPEVFTAAKLASTSKWPFGIQPTYEGKSSEALDDHRLYDYVAVHNDTKVNQTETVECLGPRYWFFGPIDCIKTIYSTSYNVSTYSVNVLKLQDIFKRVIHYWVVQFQVEVNNLLEVVSDKISENAWEHIDRALSHSEEQLSSMCDASKENVAKSKDYVGFLKSRVADMDTVKIELEGFSDIFASQLRDFTQGPTCT